MSRVRLVWDRDGRSFAAIEPSDTLVEQHAETLASWYNAPENAAMMDGSGDMTTADVIDFWRSLEKEGGRGFFGFEDGALFGDADLRGLRGDVAEFAVMVGDSAKKGRGLGKALAVMVHVFAFRELGLSRLYVPPRRDNARVHALNAFLGYVRDESPEALAYADGPDCETYSLTSAAFRAIHHDAWQAIICEDAS
jgi:RimJ/RimL family protein N-acetyltransferase